VALRWGAGRCGRGFGCRLRLGRRRNGRRCGIGRRLGNRRRRHRWRRRIVVRCGGEGSGNRHEGGAGYKRAEQRSTRWYLSGLRLPW